jgi:hypothetical protein
MNKNKGLKTGTKYGRRKGGNYPTVLQLHTLTSQHRSLTRSHKGSLKHRQ